MNRSGSWNALCRIGNINYRSILRSLKENPFYCSLLAHGTQVHQMFSCDISDVARAFPRGQDQNQNEEKIKEK